MWPRLGSCTHVFTHERLGVGGVRGAPGICNFKAMRVSKLYKTAHSEPTVGKPNY
jgi:hypothetical protein